jgi:hypothetical protein
MRYCKWCEYDKNDDTRGICNNHVDCPIYERFWDWKDAAEFEARCMNNAIIYAYIKGVEVRTLSDYMPDIIKTARLKAEEQMEP